MQLSVSHIDARIQVWIGKTRLSPDVQTQVRAPFRLRPGSSTRSRPRRPPPPLPLCLLRARLQLQQQPGFERLPSASSPTETPLGAAELSVRRTNNPARQKNQVPAAAIHGPWTVIDGHGHAV